MEAVGLVALDFDGAAVDFPAATEGGFQFAQEIFQLGRVPGGRESFENENGFSAAVRGGAAEKEFFSGGRDERPARPFDLRRTRGPRVPTFLGGFAARELERRERIGLQRRCGVGGDALFLFPRHG